MFNVCPRCGAYSEEKEIDPRGPFAICPHCGHPHRFVQLPLFVLTGASGAGKTAIGLALASALPECVTMESDILWGAVPATADDDYRSYRNTWLRVAKNIGQGGRPVVLVGTALPAQFEGCPERRYFAEIHYLALACDGDVLARRLRDRPAWRQAGTPAFLESMLAFNDYLRANAGEPTPPMTLLDTSRASIAESTAAVTAWIRARLP
jgi:hypothetical protein